MTLYSLVIRLSKCAEVVEEIDIYFWNQSVRFNGIGQFDGSKVVEKIKCLEMALDFKI